MKNLLTTFIFLSNLMGQIDFSNSIITLIDKDGNEHKNVTIQFSENSSLITLPKITLSDSSEIDIDDIQLVNTTVRKYGFLNNMTICVSTYASSVGLYFMLESLGPRSKNKVMNFLSFWNLYFLFQL